MSRTTTRSVALLRPVVTFALVVTLVSACGSQSSDDSGEQQSHDGLVDVVQVAEYEIVRAASGRDGTLVILGFPRGDSSGRLVLAAKSSGAHEWRELEGYNVRAFAMPSGSDRLVALAAKRADGPEEVLSVRLPSLAIARTVKVGDADAPRQTLDDSLSVIDDSLVVAIRRAMLRVGAGHDRPEIQVINVIDGTVMEGIRVDAEVVTSVVALTDRRIAVTVLDDAFAVESKLIYVDRIDRSHAVKQIEERAFNLVAVMGSEIVTEGRPSDGDLGRSEICVSSIASPGDRASHPCFTIDGVNASLSSGRISAVEVDASGGSVVRIYRLPSGWS